MRNAFQRCMIMHAGAAFPSGCDVDMGCGMDPICVCGVDVHFFLPLLVGGRWVAVRWAKIGSWTGANAASRLVSAISTSPDGFLVLLGQYGPNMVVL